MKNQKGLAPVFILLAIAALAAVGAGAYYFISVNSDNISTPEGFPKISKSLTDEQQKEVEQANLDSQELATIIEAAKGAGLDSEAMENIVDSVVEARKEEIRKEAEELINRDPCDTNMEGIERALKLAADAWLATDEELGDTLWEWAREAFRGYVADAALAVGATFLEQDIDLFSKTYEERKALYKEAREKFYNRALLAQQAQLFGFEDLHQKIMSGEFVRPVCVQLWDVKTEIEYNRRDFNNTMVDHWIIQGIVQDVPIYKYHPSLGLPEISVSATQKGKLELVEMWWKESIDSPIGTTFTVENEPYLKIDLEYEENLEDFWLDEVVVTAGVDVFEGKEPTVCSDYFGCGGVVDLNHNGKVKMSLPTLLLWQRKPFVHEEKKDYNDGAFEETVKTRVGFFPTKRVNVKEL